MGSATSYGENLVLDAMLGSNKGANWPATVYVALFTVEPTEGTTTGVGSEVSGGSYARVAVTNNTTNWPAASSGVKSNGAAIQFPTCTVAWGTIQWWGIFDAATLGNLLIWGALSTSLTPSVGSAPYFDIGSLTIVCD